MKAIKDWSLVVLAISGVAAGCYGLGLYKEFHATRVQERTDSPSPSVFFEDDKTKCVYVNGITVECRSK